jgi:Xaa-Pro aminopeptidase
LAASHAIGSSDTLVGEKMSTKHDTPRRKHVYNTQDTSDKLAALRQLLDEEGLDAYVVPSVDAHGSEYPPESEQRRAFISGFTGSTGTAVVLRQGGAHLFTDGRYYIQAEKQLDKNWTLHKIPMVSDWDDWLVEHARSALDVSQDGYTVGVDPTLVGYTTASELYDKLIPLRASLAFPSRNLVDAVWGDDKPQQSDARVVVHPLRFAGKPAQDKLRGIAEWLKEGGSNRDKRISAGSAIVVSELDQIAWLFNLRGGSIPYNPMFPAYAVVRDDEEGYKAILFASATILPPGSPAFRYLVEELHVEVQEYEAVFNFLISGSWQGPGDAQQLVVSDQASWAIVNAVGTPNAYTLPEGNSPIALGKSVKNDVEIEGMRRAYLRDGVCWAKWASWLEERVQRKGEGIDEYSAAEVLTQIREDADNYGGMESYEAISASGENAALPHYETPEVGSRIIDTKTPYLMDSGAQYLDGTIDTTRTVHFGKPTAEQRRAFTRVLQGHIAIDTAVFPRYTTTGMHLDVRARAPLWSDGYNYQHGTGHGIGSFLGVHEGPQGFSSSSGGSKTPVVLQPNMCLSNEPGYYKEGDFGIRTESIVVVRTVETRYEQGGKDSWLGFERITMVPIDPKLIQWDLLNAAEKTWIKEHNDDVAARLLPLLSDDKRAQTWVKRQQVRRRFPF